MKSIVALIVVIACVFVGLVYCDQTICATDNNLQNTETFNPTCVSSGSPYCRRTLPGPPAVYQCAKCLTNCDCPNNQYCSSAPSQVGECVKFSKQGSSCRPLSLTQILDLDYNQDWKCAMLYSEGGQLTIDQQGACIQGKCHYCDWLGGNGLNTCGNQDGTANARTCIYPGTLVSTHSAEWQNGAYYETPSNVWWAIFFVFFLILIGVQGAILFFTMKK